MHSRPGPEPGNDQHHDQDPEHREEGARESGNGPDAGCDFTSRRERRERGAQITRELAEELRRAAEELRIPVANLVREVVDEALDAAERVSDDLGDWVEDLVGHAERARRRLAARGFGGRWRRHHARRDAGAPTASHEPTGEAQTAEPAAPTAEARPSAAAIVGWVAISLERSAACATCWRELAAGAAAYLGVTIAPAPPTIVCPGCREGRYPAG